MGLISRFSLRFKVPAAMVLLLALVMGTYAWVENEQLETTVIVSAGDRMETVADLLVNLLAQSAAELTERLTKLAQSPPLQGFLPGEEEAESAAMDILRGVASEDSAVVSLELWTADGTCLLGWARPRGQEGEGLVRRSGLEAGCAASYPAPVLEGSWTGVRPLGEIGGWVYSEWVVPLDTASGTPPVYLVERRGGANREGVELVSRLIAGDARLFFGNSTDGVWSDFVEAVPRPEVAGLLTGAREYRTEEGKLALGVARKVVGTPWAVWLERDRSVVLAPVQAFRIRFLWIGLPVLAFGALVGWGASLRFTRPLRELTHGAEAVSRGDYTRTVDEDRRDEIGRLAAAFNVMAARVSEKSRDLEERVAERTSELEETLRQLQETQKELVRQEKLAFLGQLAGGVGHELRNPLGIMSNAVYYLRMVLQDPTPKVEEYLDVLEAQIRASEKIVNDLLDVGRSRDPERAPVDVPALTREELARFPLPRGVELRDELGGDTTPAYADEQQVRQIVFNLISNAAQAMESEGGVLTVRCGNRKDRMVILEVEDTGEGIARDQLQRIFEPLYTSKTKGIGLGLTVSRFLAELNGGSLSVESAPARGSTFALSLPADGSEEKV